VRRIRAEMDISPGKALPVLLDNYSAEDRSRFEASASYLHTLARLESVNWLTGPAPESATALVGTMKILIPMAGLIDKEAEVARLEREIFKLGKGIESGEKKLDNTQFVERAPESVVNQERARVEEARAALEKLDEQLGRIRRL